MDSKQRVKINKLLGYLSPFDTSRISLPAYLELKQSTQNTLSPNGQFSSQQLKSSSLLNLSSPHRRPFKQSQGAQQLQVIQENSLPQLQSSSLQVPLPQSDYSFKHVRSSTQLLKNQKPNQLQQQSSTSRFHLRQNPAPDSNSEINSTQSSISLSKSILVASSNALQQQPQQQQNKLSNKYRNITLDLSKNSLNPNNNSNLNTNSKEKKQFFVVEETQPQVWSELKFCGKLCEGRSFATAIEHEGDLYFYGGYDATKGVFSDFITLKLSDTTPSSFEPVNLAESNSFYPGRLCRYGAVKRGNKMVIFGGKPSSLSSTNEMFDFCFESKVFSRIESTLNNTTSVTGTNNHSKSNKMPALDSHSLSYDQKSDSLIVFGGFLGELCQYSNTVYTYAFSTNTWTSHAIPHHEINPSSASPTTDANTPAPRGSHGAAIINDHLYIYGGWAGELVFEDLWKYNLTEKKWTEIQTQKQSNHPGPRSGVQLILFGEYLIMFGGFKSLVNERNDLNVFHTTKNEWVYQSIRRELSNLSSPHRYSNSNNNDREYFNLNSEQSSRMFAAPKRHKQQKSSSQNSLLLISRPVRSDVHSQSQFMSFQEDETHLSEFDKSTNKRVGGVASSGELDLNKLRVIHHPSSFGSNSNKNEKKMALLKLFETSKEARKLLIQPSPIHLSMNSSLHSLGINTTNAHAMHEAKTEVLQRASRFTNTEAKIIGKHPGARDGYLCSILLDSSNQKKPRVIFFGGDRHRMSLNDAYELDLDLLLRSFKQSS